MTAASASRASPSKPLVVSHPHSRRTNTRGKGGGKPRNTMNTMERSVVIAIGIAMAFRAA